ARPSRGGTAAERGAPAGGRSPQPSGAVDGVAGELRKFRNRAALAAPVAAFVPDRGHALAPFRAELGGQPGADARGEARASSSGRDRQEQIAAADGRDVMEVAELGP